MNRGVPRTGLVVFEAGVGGVESAARAVARGMRLEGFLTSVLDVSEAPSLDAVSSELLVVGAPAHAFSLSSPRNQAEVLRQRASRAAAGTTVRDWLAASTPSSGVRAPVAAMFDTRLRQRGPVPTSAASRGHRLLQHQGFSVILSPRGFLVEAMGGPLLLDQAALATVWGRALGRSWRAGTTAPAHRRGSSDQQLRPAAALST